MNIITNKILSSLLVAVCFIQTATGQISCRAEIKDGLVAKDTYCIFSSVKLGQTLEWIEICRNTTHVPCDGRSNCFHDSKQMAAVADFISLWYREGGDPYCKNDGFTLWRLSAYMPAPRYIHSTKERFEYLSMQIDALLDYEKNSQWDYNLGSWLEVDMEAFVVRMLERELNKLNPVFAAEAQAFKEYMAAAEVVYDYIFIGADGYHGSSSTMQWAAFMKDRYTMRRNSMEGMLFFISDGAVPPDNGHTEFTNDLVNAEYDKYISSLPFLEDDYTIEERTAVLEAERSAWNKWIDVRAEIAQTLPDDQRSVYQQQTSILCQSKYQMIKDRNNKYIK